MLETVIFDMDGLLIDTEPVWQETERQLFRKYGIEITPELQKYTYGLRTDEQIEFWYHRSPWPEPDFKKDAEEWINNMLEYFIKEAGLMNGANYIIEFFRKKGFTLAIASSSPMLLINAFVERFDFAKYFDVLYSAQFEEYGKPHPAVYINTAKKLGVRPHSCLVFEDSFNGLLAAKSAKMKAVIIPDHRNSDNDKYDIADLRLSSLLDFGEKELQLLMQ